MRKILYALAALFLLSGPAFAQDIGPGPVPPAVGNITGLGTGVASLLAGTASGTGGPMGTAGATFSGTLTAPDGGIWSSGGLLGLSAVRVGTAAGIASGAEKVSILAGAAIGATIKNSDNAGSGTVTIWNGATSGTLTLATIYAGSVPANVANFTTNLTDFSISTPTGNLILPSLATDAALTDRSVCQVTSTSAIKFGSGTLGICLGTSSARFKTGIENLHPGIMEILRLRPKSFYLDAAHGDPKKQMYGFIAEDMVKVLPKLVGVDTEGRPSSADYLGVVPVLTRAIQQLSAIIALLILWNAAITIVLFRRVKKG